MGHPNLSLSLTKSREGITVLINMFGECGDTVCAIFVFGYFGLWFCLSYYVDSQVNEVVERNRLTCITCIGLQHMAHMLCNAK